MISYIWFTAGREIIAPSCNKMYYYTNLCCGIKNIPDFRLLSNMQKEVKLNPAFSLVCFKIIYGKMKNEISLLILQFFIIAFYNTLLQ